VVGKKEEKVVEMKKKEKEKEEECEAGSQQPALTMRTAANIGVGEGRGVGGSGSVHWSQAACRRWRRLIGGIGSWPQSPFRTTPSQPATDTERE